MAAPKSPAEIRAGINRLRDYLGARYVWWNGVWPPNQAVFYGDAPPPPTPQTVRQNGILCAGALGLFCQIMGVDAAGALAGPGTLWYEKNLLRRSEFVPGKKYPVGTVLGYPFGRDQNGHVVVVSTEPDEQGRQWTIGADSPLGLNEQRSVVGADRFFNFTYAGELPCIGTIPLGKDPKPQAKSDTEKAKIIDAYFEKMDFFPQIDYAPIGDLIVEVCREHTGTEAPLWVSTLAAGCEKEGGGKHIFGADWGVQGRNQVPFAHLPVTRDRFEALVRHVRAGGTSNGVSTMQVTYKTYLFELAEMKGGGHLQRNGIIKGANILNDLLNAHPYLNALEAYNDGSPQLNAWNNYELDFAAIHQDWKRRLS